ncbi:hypothetical protein V1460_00535 [Streptomyces sp. SCSIO 30461]|uniref:hypothetical protein n=1 Tax=Streptomyces sp. SCSIO 30461 TaxID=3118085 RepID=UPI0030D0BF6E
MRQRGESRSKVRGRTGVATALCAALCAVVALPGGSAQAEEAPGVYTFDSAAKPVRGATVSSNAQLLEAGSVYRDSIKKDAKLYYRLDLDARTNAYVSVVAVPRAGGKVEYGDGITVTIQSGSNSRCSTQNAHFESAAFTRPIAAYAGRTIEPGSSSCQERGAYYVLVERATKATSTPDGWDLEIRYDAEPSLKADGPTEAPEDWPSSSPAPPAGGPQRRAGGTGFNDAMSIGQGEWRDDIKPGQTRVFRVPVDWGQQLFVAADLGSSTASTEYVGQALVVALHNPARGLVRQKSDSYSGEPASMGFESLPPVAYENRFDSSDSTSGMRFAGWYYVSATLSPELVKEYGDQAVPLTLRVNVTGKAKQGPGYDGQAGIFAVTDDDRDAAADGLSGPGAARSDTMKLVAVAGIGAGTVLLLGLGGWTVVARRRPTDRAH